MVATKQEEPRLRKLSAICMKLPEAERKLSGDHADFRVRGKVFAYFLNNHHGDGIVAVCCKSALGENVDRVSRDPGRILSSGLYRASRLVWVAVGSSNHRLE
jgi:hypothetical protein